MAITTPGFVVRYRTRDVMVGPDRFLRVRVDEGDVHPAFVWVTDATLFATAAAAAGMAELFPAATPGHHPPEVVRGRERVAVELEGAV